MKKFDTIIKYHDKMFDCKAEMKLSSCSKSPFSEEWMKQFDEFEKDLGELESVTFVFKKGEKV